MCVRNGLGISEADLYGCLYLNYTNYKYDKTSSFAFASSSLNFWKVSFMFELELGCYSDVVIFPHFSG